MVATDAEGVAPLLRCSDSRAYELTATVRAAAAAIQDAALVAELRIKNLPFCTIAQHVVIDLPCLRLGLRRDLPWTTIVPNDDEGELGLGHLDTLTASAPEHPNFHIQRDRGAPDPLYVGIKTDGIANLHWLHEHHVGDSDCDGLGFGQSCRRHACGGIH